MAGNTIRYRSRGTRGGTQQRRYVLPGEVPSLPLQGYAQVNPGLVEMPGMNWMAAAVNQDAHAAQEPYQRLGALKELKSLSDMAGDPAVNSDLQGVAEGLGFKGVAGAIGRTRRPAIPGGAPAVPGGSSLPDESDVALLAEDLGKMAELRPLDGKMVSEGMEKLFAYKIAKAQAYQVALERQRGEARGMVDYETPAKIDQELRLRPGRLATKQGEEDIQVTGANKRQLFQTGQERVRAKQKADVDFDLAGDKAGIELSLHESKKVFDAKADPARAAAVETAKNQALTDREKARLAAQNEAYAANTPNVEGRTQKIAEAQDKVAKERFDREMKARLADFEARMKRSTEEIERREKIKSGAKANAGQQASKMAWEEATKVLAELDPETAKKYGATPGEVLDSLYGQFLDVAKKATMDPTALAVINRFGKKP